MKKISMAALGALVVLAACSDADPLGLVPEAALHSDHTWQAGSGSAWHGYTAPDVEYHVETGLLCATWTDGYLFTRDDDQYESTDFFSFDFYVEEDEDWVYLDDVRNEAGTEIGCYDLTEWEDGEYLFRVNGMARHGTGQTTTTHHTADWVGTIVLGETLRFTVQLRHANDLFVHYDLNRQQAAWDVQFIVLIWDEDTEDFEKVASCADLSYTSITSRMKWTVPDGGAESIGIPVVDEECADVNGQGVGAATYKVNFANQTQGLDSEGIFEFSISGSVNENDVTFETSAPGGGSNGGGGGAAGGRR